MSLNSSTDNAEGKAEFRCSCGRTFAHEISLKRHRWVTGHAEADPTTLPSAPAASAAPKAPVAPAPQAPTIGAGPLLTPAMSQGILPVVDAPVVDDAYAVALETLMAKVQEQKSYERRRQVLAFLYLLKDFVLWMLAGAQRYAQDVLTSGGQTMRRAVETLGLVARSLAVAGVMLVLLLGGLSFGRAVASRSQAAEPAPQKVSRTAPRKLPGGAHQDKPAQVVESFYASLGGHDFQAAYTDLSPDWQRQLAYGDFEAGYSQTDSLTCRVQGVHPMDSRTVRVDFALQTVEGDSTQNYLGSYVLVNSSRGWQIDRGQLHAAE